MEPLLEILNRTESEVLIPTKSPRETLYALREGLNYVEEHKVEPYVGLKSKFILKEKRTGIEVKLRRQLEFAEPITQLAKSQHLVLDSVTNLMELIGAVIFHKAPYMEFPNAKITGDAYTRLTKWAELNNYKITETNPIIVERINAEKDGGDKRTEFGMV